MPTSSQPSKSSENAERDSYNNLLSYIKYALTFGGVVITTILTIVTITTYQNVKEYKDDVKETITDLKSDLKNTKQEYINSIKDSREDFKQKIADFENQAKTGISQIKDNAEAVARISVDKTLREQFESRNIREIISQTADDRLRGQAGVILDQKVKERTRDIEDQTYAIARLSIALDGISRGDRSYFDLVDSMKRLHRLPIVRSLAESFLRQKITDYENGYDYQNQPHSSKTEILLPMKMVGVSSENLKHKGVDTIIQAVVRDIFINPDLHDVTEEFIMISRLSQKEFKLFDTMAIKSWFKNEYPKKIEDIKKRVAEKKFKFIAGENYVDENGDQNIRIRMRQ